MFPFAIVRSILLYKSLDSEMVLKFVFQYFIMDILIFISNNPPSAVSTSP